MKVKAKRRNSAIGFPNYKDRRYYAEKAKEGLAAIALCVFAMLLFMAMIRFC